MANTNFYCTKDENTLIDSISSYIKRNIRINAINVKRIDPDKPENSGCNFFVEIECE